MSNGYESTEAFLSGIERELGGAVGGASARAPNPPPKEFERIDYHTHSVSRGGYGPNPPQKEFERIGYPTHSVSRGGIDPASRGGRHEEDERARRRREYGDEGGRYPASTSSRRENDYDRQGGRRNDDYGRGGGGREHDGGYRGHRGGGGGGGYGYDARGAGYQGGYDDRRGRYDDHRGRGGGSGGGGGGWRDGPAREPSPTARRSPTPPGTRPISERVRKNSKWNIAPSGFESMTPMQAKATGIFGIPGQSRTLGVPGPALMRDAHGNLVVPSGAGVRPADADEQTAMSVGATQSNRQARRLYVGNIGFNANEQNLLAFFNEQMRKMGFTIEEGNPAMAAQVNGEKGYAFVEFRSVGEATNAMSFDGIVFHGQSIKIRRPKDYVGPDVLPPQALHVPGVISTNVPDGPNKIYIGGIPTYLNEDQIIELLKAFGELRSFNLVRESGINGASKGFAFCEYVDTSITDLAITGLNDMELADKRLVVQRASVGTAGQRPMAPSTGANSAPLAMAGGLGASGPGEPTKAMMLLNCVTAEELIDNQDYQEIVEDMRDECARHGRVVDMRIPRPQTASKGSAAQTWRQTKNGEPIEEAAALPAEREGVGRVYVLFDEAAACQRALQAIAGRQFAGRTVIAAFIEEDAFPSDEDGGRDAAETSMQATGGSGGD